MHRLPLGRLQLSRLPLDRSQRLCRCEERQQTKRERAPHRSRIPTFGGMRRQTDFVKCVKRKYPVAVAADRQKLHATKH